MTPPEPVATTPQPLMHRLVYIAQTEWCQPKPVSEASSEPPTVARGAVVGSRRRFSDLADEWRRDTAPLSSVARMALHPAYQEVIGMGQAALPMILAELAREPGHWFWALRAITGENPVTEEDAGDLLRMRDAWIRLGRERGWFAWGSTS